MSKEVSRRSSVINDLKEKGFCIGKVIGHGSYATVHIADYVDSSSEKKMRLACKIFDKGKLPQSFLEKFLPRELEILTKIENRHIIKVHSIHQKGPRVFVFMRHAPNGDLLQFISNKGVVREKQARVWFRQMASGLLYLHNKDIVHRDLKCENVLLTRGFNVRLADFGFARFCVDTDDRRVLSKTFCGSLAYVAPEVASRTPYNPMLADVWSLGIILFIMLNGAKPFDEANIYKMLKDQRSRNWMFVQRVRGTVSAACKSVVRYILEPDVALRPTVGRLLLHEWLRSEDKPLSRAGRLLQSAPPVHPVQAAPTAPRAPMSPMAPMSPTAPRRTLPATRAPRRKCRKRTSGTRPRVDHKLHDPLAALEKADTHKPKSK